ncbi:hypothetical protein BC936DRAFT_148033 [Jimgerdemannia flammicorona]|uniref:LysM domain-containing protein n=1 Tax=Jimgerdemannia flammicorona TaxID=994334 RepID=A0A433D3Y7_9FUNG|nr:hypothetical protein BC936DRAFT_148033 [Jimgerdemannia flammicorona]
MRQQKQWPQSFGGGGTWDDAYSYANTENGVNYLQNFKNALGSCSSSPSPSPPPTTGCTKYTVQSGDTCSKIATQFGISPWTQLIQWNPSINSNCANLAVGQVICVSGTTAAHSCPNQGAVCPSILVMRLTSTKKDTSAFEIRVVAGKVPIKKNWSLTLPANSGVISSSRGVVKKTNTGISILSEPNKEKESVGSIRFVVETKINVKQIDLSRAKFTSK